MPDWETESRLARLEEWVSRKIGQRKEDQTAQDHIHEDLNPPAEAAPTETATPEVEET